MPNDDIGIYSESSSYNSESSLLQNSIDDTTGAQTITGNTTTSTDDADDVSQDVIGTTRTRFWILGLFSAVSLLEIIVWGTWGPIMESAKYAFGWKDSYIALLDAWGPINSVVFMVPLSYFNQKYGLRVGVLLIISLLTLGTAVRCFTLENETAFAYLASVGSILAGMASCLILSLPVMISSTWFPTNERTTATAVSALSVQISMCLMYLSPLIVRSPTDHVSKDEIKDDIRTLLLIHFGIAAVLCLLIVCYFPGTPKKPPSVSASEDRIQYFQSIKTIFGNWQAIFVLLTYAYSFGVPLIWFSIMQFSLSCIGFSQTDTMYLALVVGAGTIITEIIAARIIDYLAGFMKIAIMIILAVATCFYIYFLLIIEGIIASTTASVYISVVGGIALSYAAVPITIELAVEVAYPCQESVVGAISIFFLDSNGIIFLLLMMIPSECYRWLSYVLVLSASIPIALLYTVTETRVRR